MSSQNPPPDDQTPPRKVAIDNVAPNQGMQGVARDVTIHHHHGPAAPPTPSTLTARQRAELLDRLKLRYQELLDHALPHQVRLQLGLHTRPDAVDPAWRRISVHGRRTSRPVPPGTSLLELFDAQQGQLLVLGTQGAGKTTLIVELAQMLTARAQADDQSRIPVMLNMASWRSKQHFYDWLVSELNDVVGIPSFHAERLIQSDELLLLLDGLDEVDAEHHNACMIAIDTYLSKLYLPSIVIGCRSGVYADFETELRIAGAIELEPLNLSTVEQTLTDVPAAEGVLVALQADLLLRELATTPLMINVLLFAYSGQTVPVIGTITTEERRIMVWDTYVWRIFVQRPLGSEIQTRQALYWLRWLAQMLSKQHRTDLLLDDLQPTTLGSFGLRWRYRIMIGLAIGSFLGSGLGIVLSLVSGLWLGSLSGFGGFILFSLIIIFDRVFNVDNIQRKERLIWSHARLLHNWKRNIIDGLKGGLFGGVIGGISIGIGVTSSYNLNIGIITGLVVALIMSLFISIGITLFGTLLDGWHTEDLVERATPLQGIRASLKTGLIRGSVGGGFAGLFLGLGNAIVLGWYNGLVIGIGSGLVGGLGGGLFPVIQHLILRHVLDQAGLFPWHAVPFLSAMTERLLVRDGPIYRFHHLLLRDFIADLSDDDIARLAREIEGGSAGAGR